MLMTLAILFLVFGLGAGISTAFANGMSDSQSRMSLWPAAGLLILSAVCFVLHHFLHGVTITW